MKQTGKIRSFLNKICRNLMAGKENSGHIEQPKKELIYDEKTRLCMEHGRCLSEYPIEDTTILYEAFSGRGMICNPYAIFRYIVSHKEFDHFTHVWVIDDFDDNSAIMAEYKAMPNVKFISYMSDDYLRYLAVSKYLINNVSFPGFFAKRKEQIYLNTWHGIPMKTMGFDIPGGKISSGNSAKNLLSADYLISAGKYMTDKAYMESYKLSEIYSGTILEGGFPRNDVFFHPDREKILDRMLRHGVELDPQKKIILYAPTWKGSQYSHPQTDVEEYLKLIESIERSVDTDAYQILVKPHQIVYYHIRNNGSSVQGKFVPAVLDTNEILSVTDILISDYSSIHFDFLVSGKPMVFFIPDYYAFSGYRGLYFGMDKLPGPVARTYEELEKYFEQPEKIIDGYTEKYKDERSWACPLDDGSVCARTVNALFGKTQPHPAYGKGKKKLLFYAGDFRDDDITLSFLAFLNILDTNLYDVTVLAQSGGNRDASDLILALPSAVRVLYWKPFYAASETEWTNHCLFWKEEKNRSIYPAKFYQKELFRAFGNTEFDAVISFRTDNPVFNGMMSAMSSKKILWTADGTNLPSSVLSDADLILYGTESEMKIPAAYRAKCAALALPSDTRRIEKEQAGSMIMDSVHGNRMFADSLTVKDGAWAEAMFLPVPDPQKTNFAAALRFQIKKEYETLLRDFASIFTQNHDCRLILEGDGPLKENAAALAEELKISDSVLFVGDLKNPLAYFSLCSCFVMGSELDQQHPFVLCVRSMGIPIVSDIKDYLIKENHDSQFNAKTYNEQIRKKWDEILEVLL